MTQPSPSGRVTSNAEDVKTSRAEAPRNRCSARGEEPEGGKAQEGTRVVFGDKILENAPRPKARSKALEPDATSPHDFHAYLQEKRDDGDAT